MKVSASWTGRTTDRVRAYVVLEPGELAGCRTPLEVEAELRRIVEASRPVTVVAAVKPQAREVR